MAFALVGFQARGIQIEGPTPSKRAKQEVVLKITGLTTDVDLDIGDNTGTFWTAAAANATYGDLATAALAKIKEVVTKSEKLVSVKSQELIDRIQAAAASGTAYVLTVANTRPNILFAASNGETSYTIVLEWELNDSEAALVTKLGA